MAIPYDPYTDDNSTKNPYDKFDAYSFEKSKKGIALEKQRQKAEEQALKLNNTATYSEWKPTGYSQAPTVLGRMNDEYMDGATDGVLNIYAESGTGNDLDSASTFLMDSIMATALNKDVWEVARRHDYYASMFTGSKMESKDFIEAFADSWATDKMNRKAASYMNQFDGTDDEEERAELMRKMEKLDTEILKRGDYSDRGFLGNMAISSAPILRQVTKAAAIAAAGWGIGALGGAASILSSTGNASKAVGMALKAARYTKAASIGHKAGAAVNMLDTYLTESGSFSRELYNMVDADGNRVSDTTRKVAKFIYGALATAIEYATLEPAMDKFIKAKGGAKVAKAPFMKFVRGHYMANYLWKSATGGVGESVEELLQAATSSVAQDVAKVYSNETGKTSFGELSASEVLERAWNAGEDAFLEALGPSIIAGAVPNIPASIRDTRINKAANIDTNGIGNPMKWKNQFDNMDSYVGDGKDASNLRKSAEVHQTVSAGATIMDMDKIRVKSEKPSKDYGAVSADGKAAEKLGLIDVMPDPDVNGQWVGVTEADKDKLKWLFNKGVEGVAVNVVSMADITEIDSASMQNLASQYNGKLDGDTLIVGSQKDLEALRKDLEGFGIRLDRRDNSFTIRTSEGSETVSVKIATRSQAMDSSIVRKSNGTITNRDFVSEIRNALTSNGEIETSVSEQEIQAIASLAGMLGNDVTGKITFLSAYDDSITSKEIKQMEGSKGITSFSRDAKKSARIILSENSDATTVAHEMFHVALKYNNNARQKLVSEVMKQVSTKERRSELRKFLNEHTEELNAAGIKNVDDAMSILKNLNQGNAVSDMNINECLTAMWEMFNNSDSKARQEMPKGIKAIFEKLREAFNNIYMSITGKTLMPERIANAYAGFVNANQNTNDKASKNPTIRNSSEQESAILSQKQIQNKVKDIINNEKVVAKGTKEEADSFKENGKVVQKKARLATKNSRNTFTNKETGLNIIFGRTGLGELIQHDTDKDAHVASIAHVKEFIEDGKFLGETIDNEGRDFMYFLSKFEYEGNEYLVRSCIMRVNNDFYYDHKLSDTQKIKDYLNTGFRITNPSLLSSSPSNIEDKRLSAFLQGKESLTLEKNTSKQGILQSEDNILKQKMTQRDEENKKAPQNLMSVDALNGLSKSLSDYSSNDVQVLIENNIYVPTSILTRLSSSRNVNPAIAEEIGIRKLISRFVTDSDKETASLSPNLRSFIEKMKAEKETAWNSEMEKMYTKYYIYSKVLTPTEMRSQFIEENQTMNQLLSLKEVLTKRRVYYRDSKTGKMIGRLYVPKAGYVYEQISQLTKDSPEAVVNNIRASIRKDTDAWIKAYIRSARDFEKINAVSSGDRKVDETKLGSERWLRATAEMGYLAFGDLDFAYAEKLRLASAEGGKDLMADAMKLNEASYSQDYAESARSSLPPELATLAERKNEEMKKAILGEREKSASKIENLKQEKKDAKEKAKADKEKAVKEAVEWERFKRQYSEYEIKERYEKRIKELKQKQEDDIIALRLKQYDRIDAIKDEYRDKMENQAERYRKWRKLSEQNIKDYYDERIKKLKAWYAERAEIEKIDRSIKKGLNVNLATYDYSLVEASSYLYDLINNNERKSDYRISDSDYEGLKTRKGTIDESEGIVEFYNLMVDADGNIVEDPFSGIDIPLGEERFDRTAIPDILSRYLTADTIAEINNKEKSWAKMSLQSKKNIEQALAFARADAKSRLARRKEAQAIDRNAQARESVADVLKSDIDLSDDMLSQIAKEMGEDWKAISKDAKSKAEFKEKAERYFRRNNGLMPEKEIGKLREAVNKVTQLYGQFQRFAKLMGDNVYHNFVEVPQKALDERKGNITRRNSLGDEEFGKILSDGTGKDKKGNYRHDKAKLDWLNASYEVGSAFGGDSKTKLSGWNLVGAYMYSKNIHGFVKLISRTGNDIAIEEIARINPKSTLEFINEELRQRYAFAIIEEGRRLNALAEQREYKPKKLNSILSGYDEARLLRIKKEIESSSMTSTLPSYATALGDKIIELMANETERVEKTAYSLYNSPFKMQSNYVPLYGKDSAHRDSAINGVKSKGDRVYRGMIADRTMADNYALMLEPVTVYRNAIREQETFINMTKVVNDLNWLMGERGGNLHRLIANQYGSTMANVFERQIETLAFTRTPLLGYETIGNKLVSNASAAAVAFNLPSIIKNFVSEMTSLAEGDFKGRDLMYAIREISANRDYWEAKYKALAPDIADSTFSFDYQMLKDSNSLNKYGKRKAQVLEAGLKGLEWADRKAKMTVWIASFQNGIESGMSEQDAAVKATLLVKRTQSVSNPDALSAAQRDENPWHRAIFAFTKDTFQIWNQLTLGIANDLSRGENMKAFEKAIGALLTSAILAVLAGGWLPDKDDDEFDPQEFFRDWIAQLMEYTPIVGSGIKGGIDGWDSDLITLPNELGRLMGMPFNKKDYTWQEYGKQIFDIVGSGASSMAGVPVGALNKAKKSVFADGITEGVKLDPGYLYSSAVGDWLYNADMLDLLDSLF